MGGVRGYVQFFQKSPTASVEIHVNLKELDQFTDEYPWHVHDYSQHIFSTSVRSNKLTINNTL